MRMNCFASQVLRFYALDVQIIGIGQLSGLPV
jgi:hypothetical protein